MKIGIIGLGLMGGSLAKTARIRTEAEIIGYDLSPTALNKAMSEGVVDTAMDEKNLKTCDVVLVALYPRDTISFIRENAASFGEDALIMDCCDIKEAVCEPLHDFCYQKKMWFIGAHPLAGAAGQGYDFSQRDLFSEGKVILTPYTYIPHEVVEKARKFWRALGFGQVTETTPEKHDRMLACIDELPRMAAGALAALPEVAEHRDFSDRSFADLLRPAQLNETLWSNLLLHNKKNLCELLEAYEQNLNRYREALESDDREALEALLRQSREAADNARA